ncbi:protein of unknown function [endosymbiont DhMRE of Dentiscutata heterogama]|uniref:hypothetical protein n=1 Tax=endosymbiont DhMRE of Dentiscutata heterogama TaxID=1609546 RepID=UPI000629D284|nr:hypothetical protein [endosymbiont DhMRE of Dentiscutata heterogama]CFW93392.1 protein of unknown function [endosymbiont DhMRE of Dentiscutata heterogama]
MTGTKENEIKNPLNPAEWLQGANKLMSQPNWAKSGEIREFCNKLDKIKEVVETLLQQEINKNPANKTALENIKQELIKIGGLGTITPTTGGGLTPLEKEKKALKDELKKIITEYKGETNVFGNFETEVVNFNNNAGKKHFHQNAATWQEEVEQTPADTTDTDKLDANEVNSIKFGFAHFFVQKVLENKTKSNADKKKMIDEYFVKWPHGKDDILQDKTPNSVGNKTIEEAYNELGKVDKLVKERQDLKNELQAIIDDYQGKGIVKGNFEDELNEYNKVSGGIGGHYHHKDKWEEDIDAIPEDKTKKGKLDEIDANSIRYGFAEFFIVSIINGQGKKRKKKEAIDNFFAKHLKDIKDIIFGATGKLTELQGKTVKEAYDDLSN